MRARNNLQYLMTLIHLRRDITLSGQTGVMQDMKASVGDGVCTGFRNTVNDLFNQRIEAIQNRLNILAKGCHLVAVDIANGAKPDGASHLHACEEKLQDMADVIAELGDLLDIEVTFPPPNRSLSEGQTTNEGTTS